MPVAQILTRGKRGAWACYALVPPPWTPLGGAQHDPLKPQITRLEQADPALGELVLARDALGVDAQQYVHAVPSPLGHLGGVDAAGQPYGRRG
jgi:hypothetical protein